MLEDDICLRGKIAIPIKTSQFRDVLLYEISCFLLEKDLAKITESRKN
jgi:hypothetical protein